MKPRAIKPLLVYILCSAVGALVPAKLIAASASENWGAQCAKCHGDDGAGNTKMGQKLKIRDLTSPDAQKKFTDEQAFEAIKNGLKKDGKTVMNPMSGKLSDEEITEMVSFVRSMCRP